VTQQVQAKPKAQQEVVEFALYAQVLANHSQAAVLVAQRSLARHSRQVLARVA
jgi:hypothetical protein